MELNIENMEKIASGFTADIFLIDNTKVLKLYFEGWDVNFIKNEYYVNDLIRSYSINAPETYEMITIGNRTGIIFQKLENITMKDMMKQNKNNSFGFARTLAQEHYRVNCAADTKNGLKEQKDTYKEIIESRTSLDRLQKDKLIHLLKALPEDNKICHGDFHPLNLLYDNNKIYIIDWVGALRGNPFADVAGSYIIIKIMGLETEKNLSFFRGMVSSILISKFAKTYLKEYVKISSCSIRDIMNWIPVRAATYLDFGLPEKANKKLLQIINNYV